MTKEEKKIKYSVWFRVYIDGRECYASKHISNVVRLIHQILDSYEHSSSPTFEFRRLVYVVETGAVVENVLITDNLADLF